MSGRARIKRKRRSKAFRLKVLRKWDGKCCLCSLQVPERWILEHVKPLWLGGRDAKGNMGPAHYRCAAEKTKAEASVRAKMNRQRKKHLGFRKPQRRPMMGTIASGWRKKFSGEVERR